MECARDEIYARCEITVIYAYLELRIITGVGQLRNIHVTNRIPQMRV